LTAPIFFAIVFVKPKIIKLPANVGSIVLTSIIFNTDAFFETNIIGIWERMRGGAHKKNLFKVTDNGVLLKLSS